MLNYILIIELPKNNNIIADNDYQNEGNIITAEKIDANRDILITKNMFVSGNIESGYINNKIIRKANLNGKNKDKTLYPCGTRVLSYLFGYVTRSYSAYFLKIAQAL